MRVPSIKLTFVLALTNEYRLIHYFTHTDIFPSHFQLLSPYYGPVLFSFELFINTYHQHLTPFSTLALLSTS